MNNKFTESYKIFFKYMNLTFHAKFKLQLHYILACFAKWFRRVPSCEKVLSQREHWNGCSSIWLLVWENSSNLCRNNLLQNTQQWLLDLSWIRRWWNIMFCRNTNNLPHWSHLWPFSPEWTILWLLRYPFVENFLEQIWQANSFSRMWVFRWAFRLLFTANAFWQVWQRNGFSPLWNIKWVLRALRDDKYLSHWLHWYGVSDLWVFKCSDKSRLQENLLLHSSHLWGLILLWLFSCSRSCSEKGYRLLQVLHLNGFSPKCVVMCLDSPPELKNCTPHKLQLCHFSRVWLL